MLSLWHHVATVALEDRRTVNLEWCATICLPTVLENVRERCHRITIILHHNNASTHTGTRASEFLTTLRVELMNHPPYSPDLAPWDFFVFATMKKQMHGQIFNMPEEAIGIYENLVSEVSLEQWSQCFQDWFYWMQKCVDCRGNALKSSN